MDRAIGEEAAISVTKEFKKFWIHEGRKAEPERSHFAFVNGTSHCDDFHSRCQRFLCICDDHLPCGRDSHAVAVADEDGKSDLILKVFNLLTERGLSEE